MNFYSLAKDIISSSLQGRPFLFSSQQRQSLLSITPTEDTTACLAKKLNDIRWDNFPKILVDPILIKMLSAEGGLLDKLPTSAEVSLEKSLRKSFITAVRTSNVDIVSKFIKKTNININFYDQDGNTPLHVAAEDGNIDIINLLIKNNADIHAVNHFCRTPLHYGVETDDIDIIRLFISNGANVNSSNEDFYTPFQLAITRGYLDNIDLLIENNADVKAVTVRGDTPLHLAAAVGYVDVMELLLKKNIDVNFKNKSGNTPLHIAVYRGFNDIVNILIKNNADVNLKNDAGDTPLDCAVKEGQVDIISAFFKTGANIRIEMTINNPSLLHAYLETCISRESTATAVADSQFEDSENTKFITQIRPECAQVATVNAIPIHFLNKIVSINDDKSYTIKFIHSPEEPYIVTLDEANAFGGSGINKKRAALYAALCMHTIKHPQKTDSKAVGDFNDGGMPSAILRLLIGENNLWAAMHNRHPNDIASAKKR